MITYKELIMYLANRQIYANQKHVKSISVHKGSPIRLTLPGEDTTTVGSRWNRFRNRSVARSTRTKTSSHNLAIFYLDLLMVKVNVDSVYMLIRMKNIYQYFEIDTCLCGTLISITKADDYFRNTS